jgi:hypothetical protein
VFVKCKSDVCGLCGTIGSWRGRVTRVCVGVVRNRISFEKRKTKRGCFG